MLKSISLPVFLAMVVLVVYGSPRAALARDSFVGIWKVTVTPDNDTYKAGQREYKDTLTFKGGKFISEACKAHGFEAANYDESTSYGLAGTFTCEVKSKTHQGTASWSGHAEAQEITGELTWKKPDGTSWHYTFKGERQ